MSSGLFELNSLQPTATIHARLSYLQTIIEKKVNDVALTCIETIVHWFLTTFSCFYPGYVNLYQERLVERINVKSRSQDNLRNPSEPIETSTQKSKESVTSTEPPLVRLSSLPNQNDGQESDLNVEQENSKQTSNAVVSPQKGESVYQPVLPSLPLKEDPLVPMISSENPILPAPSNPTQIATGSLDNFFEFIEEAPPSSRMETITPTPSDAISLEEFQKKIKGFFSFRENSQQIAAKLFQNVPKDLELNQLVEFLFKSRYAGKLLDAFQFAYPTFVLSPFDQIRKAIIVEAQNREYSLRNDSLLARLKEHGLDNNAENLVECYRLAYCFNHPYIYPVSQTPVPADNYSLNFLWENLNPQNRDQDIAQNIFKDGLDPSENADCIKDPRALRAFEASEHPPENWENIKASFMYRISKWADIHPNVQMNVWYDSALVTEKARQKTFEMMKGISDSRGVNLKLRDIRQLPTINGETKNTLHPGTPVYYRVDLLKVLITDHLMSAPESPKYCVVSDIDVEPMDAERLFDQRTVDYLATNGYVFNRVGAEDFENNFFIFNKEKEDIQRIHNECMVQQAKNTITELRPYPEDTALRVTLGAQSIFKLYREFREEVGEHLYSMRAEDHPRKVVQSPRSQFDCGRKLPKSDHRAETFRFIGDSNIPYTRNGRNYNDVRESEGQIRELIDWVADPLPSIE